MARKPAKAKSASSGRKKAGAKKSVTKARKPASKKVVAKKKVGPSRSTVKKASSTSKKVVKKTASQPSVSKKKPAVKKATVSKGKTATREPSVVGKKIRQIREAMGASRPEFADLMKMPAATLKNYELGYREVGGQFLVDFSRNSKLYPLTLWLLSGKTSKTAGQISVAEFKKKATKKS